MLKSGLSVWCYSLNPLSVPTNYGPQAISLTFTTLSPGGHGTLKCTINGTNPRLPLPQLALFSRVAVMTPLANDQSYCVFLGEITDSTLKMDAGTGEYLTITALGLGSALRDDPRITNYTLQTVQQIAINQLTGYNRSTAIPVDSDTSALYPDNPATTYSPAYNNRTCEEVIADTAILAGDYAWGTWAHPGANLQTNSHVDAAGFPTAQAQIHQRDTTTSHYQVSLSAGDVVTYSITPSTERAYNVIQVTYNDPLQATPVGVAVYTDSRLGGSGAQGTAPFRRRVFVRDLSSNTAVNLSQAQSIANALGAQYQNISNKTNVVVKQIKNAFGRQIPLWSVQADHNIIIPELAPRGTYLPTASINGVSQFYIVQTVYRESDTIQELEIQCDNYTDDANIQIARLQLAQDAVNRAKSVSAVIQTSGVSEKGFCGDTFFNMTAGNTTSCATPFRTVMTKAPTSITLTTVQTTNASGAFATSLSVYGFILQWTVPGNGVTLYYAYYQTNGNCLLTVDVATYSHHCDNCNTTATHPFSDVVLRSLTGNADNTTPAGQYVMTVVCPTCQSSETFSSGFGTTDCNTGDAWRDSQVTLIRALQAALGLQINV